MLSFIFYFFLFYLGYKLLFDFIIPVVRTTLKVKKGFRAMRDQMKQQSEQTQQFHGKEASTATKVDKEDYIDFEEVK